MLRFEDHIARLKKDNCLSEFDINGIISIKKIEPLYLGYNLDT